MTIHDELVRELIYPDEWGKPQGYITQIVGGTKIKCVIEELFYRRVAEMAGKIEYEKMTPDIVVFNQSTRKTTAIELENDIEWDFGQSLRQVKKYKRNDQEFNDVVVIIPKRYERFASLYKEQGFRVYLWKATRIWKCVDCGNKMEDERTAKPKCSNKSCKSSDRVLIGLKESSSYFFKPVKYQIGKIAIEPHYSQS